MFKPAKVIVILLCIGAVSFLLAYNVLLGFLACLILLLGVLIFLDLKFGLVLVIFSLALGQLVRIPLPGTESFFLPNDVIIPVMILFWIFEKLVKRDFKIQSTPLNAPLFFFLGIALISLIWGIRNLAGGEALVSSFYYLRFLEYALFFYVVLDVARGAKEIKKYVVWIFVCSFILAILGFLQYIFVPDFSAMAAKAGWDPHIKRLLSTWFDPNFMGGFFVFILSFVLSFFLYSPNRKHKLFLAILGLVLFGALILTYSRSAFLAFLAMLLVLGILKSKKLLLGGLAALLILVGVSDRLQTRLAGATEIDVTAQARIASWLATWEIAQDHLFLGVGFNTFKYVQSEYGKIGSEASHSDFGSDSSFLTILVTTGILGFLAYLWLLGAMFWVSFKAWREERDNKIAAALGLGMLGALSGMLVHSQFTNSLLYPHFMEVIWIFLAIMIQSQGFKYSLAANLTSCNL